MALNSQFIIRKANRSRLRLKHHSVSEIFIGLLVTLVVLSATATKLLANSAANNKYVLYENKLKLLETRKQASTAITYQELKSWSIIYEVYGGIAGLRRQLLLDSDTNKLIAIDKKRDKRITQQISSAQATNIKTLLKNLNFPVYSSKLNTHCADCFQYKLTLKLNEQQYMLKLDNLQLQQHSEYAALIKLLSSILNKTLSQ